MSDAEAKEECRKSAEDETQAELLKRPGQSQVYTATRDTLFPKKIPHTTTHALVGSLCLLNVHIRTNICILTLCTCSQ